METTGAYTVMMLLPLLLWFFRKFPLARRNLLSRIPLYALVSMLFGGSHTSLMYLTRNFIYWLFGLGVYDYGRPDAIEEIAIQVASEARVLSTSAIVKRLLERTHNGVQDYEMIIPAELLAQSQKTQRVFNIVMGSIAAISLLVGGIGIGIMNIILASVTERTKEI